MTDQKLPWEIVASAVVGHAEAGHLDDIAELLARLLPHYVQGSAGPRYFHLFEEHGIHLTPVHFYSPIPDTRELPDALWAGESTLAGVDMRESAQLELLRDVFPRYRDEYERIPADPTDRPYAFHLNNPAFGGTDALALYCMVRHFKPELILEVGSGFSSRLAAEAALANGTTRLVCIEPHPDPVLAAGFPGLTTLVPKRVQEVGLEPFERLSAGDILFVDSSHVVTCGGDVTFLILEVLPRLRPGVLVHFHDIFLPREYPKTWVKDLHLFWTEQYLLHAFLIHNTEFEVLLANAYLETRHREALRSTFPSSPWWGGGSFWMRRRA